MIRVKINNFQSISSASFDIEGFTVIVGKNNRGKSAIVRAVDAALTNRTGGGLVKWDQPKTSVSLNVLSRDSEELSILWEKGDSTTYKVNDKSYSKLNKAVPQPILDAGFKNLEINDKKFTPIIGHQFKELFLINEPGSTVTEVISTMYDFDVINDADILCQKRLRASKSLLKTRTEDLESIQEKLQNFKDIDLIINKFNILREKEKTRIRLISEIEEITKYKSILEQYKNTINKLKNVKQISIPSTEKETLAIEEYTWFLKTCLKLQESVTKVKALKDGAETKVPNITNIGGIVDEYRALSLFHNQLKQSVQNCDRYKKIIPYLVKIEVQLQNLNKIEQDINIITVLDQYTGQFLERLETIKKCEELLVTINTEYINLQQDRNEFKICPVCEQELPRKE